MRTGLGDPPFSSTTTLYFMKSESRSSEGYFCLVDNSLHVVYLAFNYRRFLNHKNKRFQIAVDSVISLGPVYVRSFPFDFQHGGNLLVVDLR